MPIFRSFVEGWKEASKEELTSFEQLPLREQVGSYAMRKLISGEAAFEDHEVADLIDRL